MNNSYNFEKQMKMSEGIGGSEDTKEFILSRFPNAVKVEKANKLEDIKGTDWWITMNSGEVESLDLKARSKDYSKYGPDKDDLALEVWSKIGEKKVGWTRDTSKRTNWIMWKWNDTKRYMLIPFPWLCSVFNDNWEEWVKKYQAPIQNTVGANGEILWQSQCVYVPRRVLWNAVYDTFGGAPTRHINLHTSPIEGLKRAELGYNAKGGHRQ